MDVEELEFMRSIFATSDSVEVTIIDLVKGADGTWGLPR